MVLWITSPFLITFYQQRPYSMNSPLWIGGIISQCVGVCVCIKALFLNTLHLKSHAFLLFLFVFVCLWHYNYYNFSKSRNIWHSFKVLMKYSISLWLGNWIYDLTHSRKTVYLSINQIHMKKFVKINQSNCVGKYKTVLKVSFHLYTFSYMMYKTKG